MNEHAKLHECISSRNSFLVSENTIIHMKCKKKKKKKINKFYGNMTLH